MTRHGIAANVKTRIYLEGRLLENAMTSVMVHGEVGQPAQATINLVPTNTIKHIMAGTYVHVFCTDPWDLNPKGDLSDFKLLFEGVVISRGFARQDDGRSLVVQCAGPEVYWTSARQYWLGMTNAGGGIVDQLAVQTSGGYGRFVTAGSSGTYSYALSRMKDLDPSENEERFLDTMLSVIDDIGNVNPYYTNARNRFRITDRVLRLPAGKTEKLFQLNLLGDFLNGLAQRVSGQSSLLDVVNTLLSPILHEWVPVIAPPYIKADIFMRDAYGNLKRNKTTVKRQDNKGRTIKSEQVKFEIAEDNVIGGLIFKPHVYTLSPPSCNVLFPNMYQQMSFNENFLGEPTRVRMEPQLITRTLSNVTKGMLIMRPAELEIFTAITFDAKNKTQKKREPDARFADGEAQTSLYHDFDWSTNEERVRGIVYSQVNIGPAPTTLTLTDQGKKEGAGGKKGGMPKYLQNVASYEFYKAKFVSRQTSLSGPLNIRPVVGFSLLALDDSDANLNVVAYLGGITHYIQADGAARTEYALAYPRLADEPDFNRPKFKGGLTDDGTGRLDLDLVNEGGNYLFEKAFDGLHRPPIPEWFSEDFTSLVSLTLTYKKLLGQNVKVIENILFEDPAKAGEAATSETLSNATGYGLLAGAAAAGAGSAAKIQAEERNESIDQLDAVRELVARYQKARGMGLEFEQASQFTDRTFTKIDEAFRFVGAAPRELVTTVTTLPDGTTKRVSEDKFIEDVDYKRHALSLFRGTTLSGYGYTGVKVADSVSATGGGPGVMGSAFPVFETEIHTGKEATDLATREAKRKFDALPSSFPRFEGRPQMYDFEYRIWQDSLAAAGYAPDGEKIADGAVTADYVVEENGETRLTTPEERAAAIKARQDQLAADSAKEKKRKRTGTSAKGSKSHSAKQQAPTGDSAESNEKLPLPQPLSERQVIELRRSIIEQYNLELTKTRGFTG